MKTKPTGTTGDVNEEYGTNLGEAFVQTMKQANGNGKNNGNGKTETQKPGGKQSSGPRVPKTPQQKKVEAAEKAAADEAAKKPLSLKDRLMAMATGVQAVVSLREGFAEADAIGASPEIVNLFVETVKTMDEIGIRKLMSNMTENEAADKWFSLDWDKQEMRIRRWAEDGDTNADTVLTQLQPFNQNIILRDELREMVERVESRFRDVQTQAELEARLKRLVKDDLAFCKNGPDRIPANGIVIRIPSGKVLYLPVKGRRVAEIGWQFVKKAADGVKAPPVSELDQLQDKSTPKLTPASVSKGRPGKLFLFLSQGQAVLIDCTLTGGFMTAVVVEGVGLPPDVVVPSNQILWDKRYNSLEGGTWCDPRIPIALKAWDDKISGWKMARVQEDEKITKEAEPIATLATFPLTHKDQGLTRLLNGEKGTMMVWNRNFEWGRDRDLKKGAFGVAIERNDTGLFVRKAVSIGLKFDHSWEGKELPTNFIEDSSAPKVELPKMEGPHFSSYKMVETLVRKRLRLESEAVTPAGE